MVKRSENEILQSLNIINWEFKDYNSAKYPLDINSIPWYPATFPAPIPKYLIGLLSESGDMVFDPFGGKGTTAIEALKQKRKFIYNDLNPHAVLIMRCLLDAVCQGGNENEILQRVRMDQERVVAYSSTNSHPKYCGKKDQLVFEKLPDNIEDVMTIRNIRREAAYWFHADTLMELLHLFDYINTYDGIALGIRKLAFISILKEVSSQRGHFSYVTDNCKPADLKYYNAIEAYCDMLERIQRACIDFIRQYEVINKANDLQQISQLCIIHEGDAKDCSFISDESVDLVITSPPYLCAQDYILTMRLNDFFFPNDGFVHTLSKEIGPRRLRRRSGIVKAYFDDMELVTREIYRVLKENAYYCLIIGQGKGKVTDGINVIEEVKKATEAIGFIEVFKIKRCISYRTNRIGGVDKEHIIIYKKTSPLI